MQKMCSPQFNPVYIQFEMPVLGIRRDEYARFIKFMGDFFTTKTTKNTKGLVPVLPNFGFLFVISVILVVFVVQSLTTQTFPVPQSPLLCD